MLRLKKKSFLVCAAIGEGASLLLTALLLLPVALAIQKRLLPQEAGAVCASVTAGAAVFASTLVIARIRGRQTLALGGAVALGFVALAALLCALGGQETSFGAWLWRLAAAAAAGGVLGAVLSLRQNTHRKKKH